MLLGENMKLKDKLNIWLHNEELIKQQNEELNALSLAVEDKKKELISLKKQIILTFQEEYPEYEYMVDITNCYIITLHNKKYITLRTMKREISNIYTRVTGNFIKDYYWYYDVLNREDSQYSLLYTFQCVYAKYNNPFPIKYSAPKPENEQHILECYPELKKFYNNQVPNTYLQKLYNEMNNIDNQYTKK